MPLETGKRLGPYEILGLIGVGGMGEVYKANDTRLDRTVAVKVLPEHLASSSERRASRRRPAPNPKIDLPRWTGATPSQATASCCPEEARA